jgi:hypothetical protein
MPTLKLEKVQDVFPGEIHLSHTCVLREIRDTGWYASFIWIYHWTINASRNASHYILALCGTYWR